jgi:hypothetical protein
MNIIKEGDYVKHKTKPMLNGGLSFTVLSINDDMALCEYFDTDLDQTMRQQYFPLSDLILINKVEGGFQ